MKWNGFKARAALFSKGCSDDKPFHHLKVCSWRLSDEEKRRLPRSISLTGRVSDSGHIGLIELTIEDSRAVRDIASQLEGVSPP